MFPTALKPRAFFYAGIDVRERYLLIHRMDGTFRNHRNPSKASIARLKRYIESVNGICYKL